VRYLGITVGADPEMTPRKALVSVGYAYRANNADNLDGKDDSDFVQQGEANSISTSMIQDNMVTAAKITPDFVSSVDGVKNDGGNIDLVAGSNITINPDDANNKITISASMSGGDNLGNHTATENIKLNEKWLSNDGGNEGIKVDNSGNVTTTSDLTVGDDVTAPGYITSNDYIKATNSSTASFAKAIYGIISSTSPGGYSAGVRGENKGTGGLGIGVYGSQNGSGWGVYGSATSGRGVYGFSTSGEGVYGKNNNGNFGYLGGDGFFAVYGENSNGSYGYLGGEHYATLGQKVAGIFGMLGTSSAGVYGFNNTGSGWAGYFAGDVRIDGSHPAYGATQMDHPFDPSNKYLNHSFVVSPDMKNVYDGLVVLDTNGEAEVVLPEWCEAINKDFRYQLTCIGGFAQVYIAEKIKNNRFKIAGGTSGMEVCWLVTGIRDDAFAKAHRVQVETEKIGEEKGKYLHPVEHSVPETLGIHYEHKIRLEEEQRRIKQEENKRMKDEQ